MRHTIFILGLLCAPVAAHSTSNDVERVIRGRVTKAGVTKTTLNEPAVEACVVREVSKMRFPQSVDATINYPFMFSSGS